MGITLDKSMTMGGLLGWILLCGLLHMTLAKSDHAGFPTWLANNLEEFENVAVAWDNSSAVPEWLKGTYFKNGPARQDFGGKLSYGNMADGWAKISKFNVDSTGVRLSSKFLKTDTYRDCDAAREIVPQMTMGPVLSEDGSGDGWGMGDLAEIASHTDNTIVTITKMGAEFIASTDLPKVNIFSPSTLEWIGYYDPKLDSTMSTAHWAPEPGTNNMLNYHVKGVPGVWETLHLYRYPEGSLHTPQEIGKGFHIPYSTMIHQFSVTENYAIFFLYPISIDMGCATMHLLHNMLECVKWHGDNTDSLIYVMNLKTGETTSPMKTEAIYSTHHINAYEVTENELDTVVVDLVIPPWYALTNFTDKEAMLNTEDTGSMENLFEIRRYQIDIQNEQVFSTSWENNAAEAQPYYNQFDFPKVNPNYYGRHYCYAYGQAIVDVRRQYLVKKNVCDSTEDKIWYKEEHYSGEPIFIPNPNGSSEDDGVLLVIVLDGSTRLSYLLLLDGQSFETLAEARLETFIPMSIHGSWFDEIF